MATAEEEEPQWEVKFREDEELEFFTELAVHETERWVTAITKKAFAYPDDPRKSLENGILLCELLNCLKAGAVKRINKLPTPIAGLDNLNVFLKACREHFGLNDTHLFYPSDLEDLSQRAIAESEHELKDEQDRRLRNVAITVYWLGRSVSQTYPGPKLDQSAFSALVHHQHRHSQPLVSESSLRRDSSNSWESNGQSSAYGSHEGSNSHRSLRETVEQGPRHVRDSSYDSYTSYGKGSEDSLDEFEVDENGMPIPRYGSAQGLNQSGRGSSHEEQSTERTMYSDKNSVVYRSSPDLFNNSKRRSSSTDSTDGSYHGSHSRQSSDSTEMYPTRRFSTQLPGTRKSSVSTDPLQFIKSKGATGLALTAEEQMRLAAETKKIKFTGTAKEEDDEWQSNLSTWKNRRKSQSERSYQMKEELEQMEREKEAPITATQTTKTFAQMQEERERRKSASSKHFYPIADEEEEDDIFSPATSKQQESTLTRGGSQFQSSTSSRDEKESKSRLLSKPQEDVAPWAQGSGDEDEDKGSKEENNNSTSKPSETPERVSRFDRDFKKSTVAETKQRRSGLNLERDTVQQFTQKQDGTPKEDSRNGTSAVKLPSKVSNILKSLEKKEEDTVQPRSSGVERSVNVSARKKSFETSGAGNSVGSYRSWSTDQDKPPSSWSALSETSSRMTSTVYASGKQSGKDFVEKTIKISQKPNNEKGFGFTLAGGADKRQPVIVEKVGLGTAADICELHTKDEVLAINGESVARMTSAELSQKVKDTVRVGQIELRIKRALGSGGGDFEDEEDFLSSEEELDTPDRSVSKSSSVRAENSFDSLDSREDQQAKTDAEHDKQWIGERNTSASVPSIQMSRRGGPTSTSSDSGYDAQTFSPYINEDDTSQSHITEDTSQPSINNRRRHFYPLDQDDSNFVNSKGTEMDSQFRSRGHYSGKQSEAEVTPRQQVQVESRKVITMRREVVNAAQDDDAKPASAVQKLKSQPDNDSDFGPPAALRKWQRQRPRNEYTFESDDPQPHFYSQMRLSSTLPRGSERPSDEDAGYSKDDSVLDRASEDFNAAMHSKPPPEIYECRFNLSEERKRLEDWNKQQEQERQPAEVQASQSGNAVEIQFPFDKRQFEAERGQIQQQYQSDLQRAADVERQKQQQERELLEPQMEKTRILEERRAQRQARLRQYAQEADDTNSTPTHETPPQQPPPPQQQHTSTWSTQLPGNKPANNQSGILVIDPRNRADDYGQLGDASQPYQFQLQINQDTPTGLVLKPEILQSLQYVGPVEQAALLEVERERILQVERERIRQEELQRIEAERKQKEEEEMRRIRSMEEQLRQQQEMLRRQEEQLRREQDRLERERQQLQQTAAAPPLPAPAAAQELLHFETVTSKVREGSPAYTSTVIVGPRRSEGQPQMSASRGRDSGAGHGPWRSEPAWDDGRNQGVRQDNSWRGGSQNVSASQSNLPKWPPSDQERPSNTLSHEPVRKQLSREDMLAMNRKATPLQAKPPSPTPVNQASVSNPIIREAPSKGQLHSLNSVPRAKIRNPDGWLSPRDTDDSASFSDHSGSGRDGQSQQPAPARRSEGYRSQSGGSQDHWLIQEAERRRIHDNGDRYSPNRAQFSGPIKPAADGFGNRWRDDGTSQDPRSSPNMPAQIRQTLLQKTAGARGSTGSNYSGELPSTAGASPRQSRASPNTSMSQTLPPNYTYDMGHQPRSSAVPPSHRAPSPDRGSKENGMSVSGKQRCSHCNQELGFGAAMVIESLGLFYHVQCFRCCVCRTPLGNGVEGADVRVRVDKLHCPNCYSNDEAGLKFSKV